MYIPKFFTPKELFPPEIAFPKNGKFDLRNWRRFDGRILRMADQIREDHGKMTGNEGNLTGCGFRLSERETNIYNRIGPFKNLIGRYMKYDINTLSQHIFGRAIDGHPEEKTSFEIRKAIIQNPSRYSFIRFLEIDISWLHFDCRNNGGKLELWSPARGFVDSAKYLSFGDR